VRSLADVERDQIANALQLVQGNKAAAARALGIDRKTLYRKLDAYGISD
jgi:transcriptional regulator of acetoin/glycerol metabolism